MKMMKSSSQQISTQTIQNMKGKIMIVCLFVTCGFIFNSCVSVKEYQKMYLNDKEMDTASKKLEMFELGFESYREGASGASGGKSGGGCGCN